MKDNTVCVINDLSLTTKINEKLRILQENKEDLCLERVFHYAYSKQLNYYITSAQLTLPEVYGDVDHTECIFHVFDSLNDREFTGHAAVSYLEVKLSNYTKELRTLALRILDRDLRCGVTLTLAGQVFPNLEQKYPIMLALKDEEKNRKKFTMPVIAQVKSDGGRVNLHVNTSDQTVVAYSRNGRVVDCINDNIRKDALSISHKENEFVIDGELLVNSVGGTADRKTGNGIINKAIRGTISDEERDSFYITAWDFIPISVFKEKEKSKAYDYRLDQLSSLIHDLKHIQLIETRVCNSWEEVYEFNTEVLSRGGEGLIVKTMKGLWEPKRSNSQMKIKEVIEADVLVTGMYEGTGKYAGMMGGVYITDGSGQVSSACGSGFSDEQRLLYWNEKDLIVNKISEITYNDIIVDKKKNTKSFFLPIFKRVRDDKNVADNLMESGS